MTSVKLRDLLLYIISRFPRGVGRTRLMKIVFLVDALSMKSLGKRITSVEWRRWHYGPFSKDILDELDRLVEDGDVLTDIGPEVRYFSLNEPPSLPSDVREVVDKVIREYGFLPLRKLLERVYKEYNIREIPLGERIGLDWRDEIIELARSAGSDKDALIELIGRLSEEYEEETKLLPPGLLALYALVAPYIASKREEELREITTELLDLLEYVKKHREDKEPDPVLRRRATELYRRLEAIATEILEG